MQTFPTNIWKLIGIKKISFLNIIRDKLIVNLYMYKIILSLNIPRVKEKLDVFEQPLVLPDIVALEQMLLKPFRIFIELSRLKIQLKGKRL